MACSSRPARRASSRAASHGPKHSPRGSGRWAGSPETGYGYIRAGRTLGDPSASLIEAFVEKPDSATAREYVASGRYLWNSGIFAVRASAWLDAISNFRKD